MGNEMFFGEERNYRALYGKLFAALLNQFGADYISEIEDAIHNSLLKSLKIRSQNTILKNMENWLFIVARNDLLNQIKKDKEINSFSAQHMEGYAAESCQTDLRLQTVLFISAVENISSQAKILFALKDIFGLSISEISRCTLMGKEAVYKSIARTKKNIQSQFKGKTVELDSIAAVREDIARAEEIFYAVFNIGYDCFDEKAQGVFNEDLCLDAMALAKLLYGRYKYGSTGSLLALFCFHAARSAARVVNGRLISFFSQDREKWNTELIALGFHYLKKPKTLNRFYLEAVIISRYMSIAELTQNDWLDIVKLHEIMQQVCLSPIARLNYCFCLAKIGKTQQALQILSQIEKELPAEHIYFSLVKAKILKETRPEESDDLFTSVLSKMNQKIRKEYLLENESVGL